MASPRRWVLLCLVVFLLSPGHVRAQKAPPLADVLQAAADYLVKYSDTLSVVAAEEDYVQYETSSGKMLVPVRLTSDVVLVGIRGGQARSFRDLVAIDSKPVRARDDRLLALLKSEDGSRLLRAGDITETGVRRYVTSDLHALDDPLLALEFLRKEAQGRSLFKMDGTKTMNGVQVAIVKFTEQNPERLVPSPENAPAIGKFWIDVVTGVVRQTDMSISGRTYMFHAAVKYALDPHLEMWLPAQMDLDTKQTAAGTGMNNMGGGGGYGAVGTAEAHVTYSRYRR